MDASSKGLESKLLATASAPGRSAMMLSSSLSLPSPSLLGASTTGLRGDGALAASRPLFSSTGSSTAGRKTGTGSATSTIGASSLLNTKPSAGALTSALLTTHAGGTGCHSVHPATAASGANLETRAVNFLSANVNSGLLSRSANVGPAGSLSTRSRHLGGTRRSALASHAAPSAAAVSSAANTTSSLAAVAAKGPNAGLGASLGSLKLGGLGGLSGTAAQMAYSEAAEVADAAVNGMPDYEFGSLHEEFVLPERMQFVELGTGGLDGDLKEKSPLDVLKLALLNGVAASLIGGPDFYSRHDPTRCGLTDLAEAVLVHDGEFICKVALYTRQHLNIRTTANFLLALAANHEQSRCYLAK